jgi:hypothetical protein
MCSLWRPSALRSGTPPPAAHLCSPSFASSPISLLHQWSSWRSSRRREEVQPTPCSFSPLDLTPASPLPTALIRRHHSGSKSWAAGRESKGGLSCSTSSLVQSSKGGSGSGGMTNVIPVALATGLDVPPLHLLCCRRDETRLCACDNPI